MIARGLGRSYGDAAQLSGGLVVSNLGLSDVGAIDERGVVTLGAGVSVDELLTRVDPPGLVHPRHARHPSGHHWRRDRGGRTREEPPP